MLVITLRTLDPEQWPLWRELRLQALAESPQAFGSKLADWQGEGDTEQRWRARLVSVPYNVIAELDGAAVGMVSATPIDEDEVIELISMWVAPFARGKSVGDALLNAVIAWATIQSAKRVQLCVVETNRHAVGLYQRHGFAYAGQVEDPVNGAKESVMSITLRKVT